MTRKTLAAILAASALFVAACGGSDTAVIETVPATEAADNLAEPPTGLVTLDVRTLEEFHEVRIAGASNLDFYAPDFSDRLDTLDKTGLAENTYVIFTSDNGGGFGGRNGPLAGGKARMTEGGLRVPTVVRGPGVLADAGVDPQRRCERDVIRRVHQTQRTLGAVLFSQQRRQDVSLFIVAYSDHHVGQAHAFAGKGGDVY